MYVDTYHLHYRVLFSYVVIIDLLIAGLCCLNFDVYTHCIMVLRCLRFILILPTNAATMTYVLTRPFMASLYPEVKHRRCLDGGRWGRFLFSQRSQ